MINQKLLCRVLTTKGFPSIDTAENGLVATQMVAAQLPSAQSDAKTAEAEGAIVLSVF